MKEENKYPNIPSTYQQELELVARVIDHPLDIDYARRYVKAEMFNDLRTRKVWETLTAMDDRREDISLSSVYPYVDAEFYTNTLLQKIMDKSNDVALSVPASVNALITATTRRRAYLAGLEMMQAASGTSRPEELKRAAEDFVAYANGVADGKEDLVPLSQCVNEVAEHLQKMQKDIAEGKRLRVPTSFRSLDFITYGGFANGNLVIIAARPSVGKTAIALQMMAAAGRAGIGVGLYSLEMTRREITLRMLCSTGQVDGYDLANARIEWPAFEQAVKQLDGLPVYMNDKSFSLEEVSMSIRRHARQGKIGVAYIDYLGLLELAGGRSRYEQVSDATRRLKLLAKMAGIPVVVLCQLNRSSVADNRAPDLYDLRDSGSIEQDADIVLMMERSRKYKDDGCVTMYIRKNRQGRCGDNIVLNVTEGYTVFTEREGANEETKDDNK